jgi:hypothetical protein
LTRAHYYRRHRLGARKARGTVRKPAMAFIVAPVFAVIIASCAGFFATGATYYAGVRATMDSPEQAIASRGGGARIFDRNGTLLYEYVDPDYGRQEPVKLDGISPLIQDATIAAEDASFTTTPASTCGPVPGRHREPEAGRRVLAGPRQFDHPAAREADLLTKDERQERRSPQGPRGDARDRAHRKRQAPDPEWYLNEIPYGGVLTGIEASEGTSGYRRPT